MKEEKISRNKLVAQEKPPAANTLGTKPSQGTAP